MPNLCVHELVEAWAKRAPDAVAVVSVDGELDYRALNGRANQLARYLQRLGVGPETLAGVCLERGPEMVVGLLAVLKAGATYLPLDPAYPQARLAFMLEDARATALLTQEKLLDRLPDGPHVICLDTVWREIARESDENLDSGVLAAHPAYVIYTSGSTGQPKGVQVTHGSLLNLIFWHQSAFRVSPADRATQLAGPGFDASVWEMWPYLTAGASIHLPDEEMRLSPLRLQEWLLSNAITISFLPTPLAERVLALPWPGRTTLRTLLTGGDKLHTHPVPGLPFELVNNYGPTEATVVATSQVILPQTHADAPPPIGRPIDNIQVYLLNARLQPVPVETPGELYIGGDGLARGYLYRPALTAERFIPNPFAPPSFPPSGGDARRAGGARLYRTGDLARYRPDGNIEFLGRVDDQVKIRGFRVELGEIEAVLGQYPGVREAVVVACDGAPAAREKRLVAYVVPRSEDAPTPGDLQEALSRQLPDYMVPAAFVRLDAWPLTAHGKIDRRALPEPKEDQHGSRDFARTPVEEMLLALWSQVLDIERPGVHDNFFALGGHSLLAAQIVTRLQQLLGREFAVRTLFEAPTVARLAERVERSLFKEQTSPAPPIVRVSRAVPLLASYAQQQLWLIDQLDPGNVAYNISYPLRLSGSLDVAALKRSLDEIVQRHEALRTTFDIIDDQPVQVIAPVLELDLPLVDLGLLSPARREVQARRLAREQGQQPVDLAHGPLIKVTLLRLGDQEHSLLLTMHHIVVDGWSVGVLLAELETLYAAFSADELSRRAGRKQPRRVGRKQSPLPDLPVQYADYAAWQRDWLQGEELERQLAYWKRQLAGAPAVLQLPTDRLRPPVQTYRGAQCHFLLSRSLAEGLRTLSQREGVTLFMMLLAAFKVLLFRYTGQRDIVVGSPIANRNRSEIEALIGYFVNTLVLRTGLGGDPTFRELLGRVREMALEAYAHQELPFERLVQALRPELDRRYNPLFQVMFTFQNAPLAMPTLPGLDVKPMPVDAGSAQFDLDLTVEETAQGIEGVVEYNTDLFDESTIRRMLDHYQTLLESVVADPDQALSALLPQVKIVARPTPQPEPQPDASAQNVRDRTARRRSRLSERRAGLSAEKRTLLEKRMRGE